MTVPEDHAARPRLIVGLGNPGAQYTNTRHNVGFQCVDRLAERHGIKLNDKRPHAILGEGAIANRRVVLAKPRTFMNNSGLAAQYLIQRFGAPLDQFIVIIDDMDLVPGKLRLRGQGSSGGHNGLNSINSALGSSDYARVRIGIGRPVVGAIKHVLGGFDDGEWDAVREAIERGADAVEAWVDRGIDYAMNQFN